MKIAIIGSGNVGGALAQKFIKAGHTVLVGAKYHALGGGFMADFNQFGKDNFKKTSNLGGFLRWEF